MTNAFTDITEDTGSDTSSDDSDEPALTSRGEGDTVTNTFTDKVRSTLPEPEENLTQKRYEDPDSTEKADDVDPRGLFRTPTVNELRYYAREGPYGKAIVEQPIEDTFKNGYTIHGDNTNGKIREYLDQYKPYYKQCEIKSRRDGMCVLMHQIADGADSVSEPIPSDGGTFEGFQIWTIDNLSGDLAAGTVEDYTEYNHDQIYVSGGAENGGVAVVDDVSHPDHGDVLGFGVEPRQDSTDVQSVSFVHIDRCEVFRWGEHVDGPLGNSLRGTQIGESVLTPVLQPLMATQMGFWAIKNILHRYSAPLHAVEPPESWGQEEFDQAREKLQNLSMTSEAVLPPGSELSVAEGVSEFDPEPFYSTLVEAICAGTVFTKSYLQGTQTGTVSGSETDLKGYFNGIHLLRTERTEEKFRNSLRMVSSYDQSTIPRVSDIEGFDIEWGPLFKPTDLEQAEGAVSLVTAATNAIKNYVMTPDEARSLVSEEWATFDIDVDLGELTEQQMDDLDRININEAGQGIKDNEPDVRQNPMQQNGGGQPEGQTRESSQPVADSLSESTEVDEDDAERSSALTDEQLDQIADKLAEKIN